jgi:hypothetical protein
VTAAGCFAVSCHSYNSPKCFLSAESDQIITDFIGRYKSSTEMSSLGLSDGIGRNMEAKKKKKKSQRDEGIRNKAAVQRKYSKLELARGGGSGWWVVHKDPFAHPDNGTKIVALTERGSCPHPPGR